MSKPYAVSPMQGRFTSAYGWRTLNGRRAFHGGIDIAPPTPGTVGSLVAVMFAGTIVKVVQGRQPGQPATNGTVVRPGYSGNGFTVENPDGEQQDYIHVETGFRVGDKVSPGDVNARTDRSGIQTGPHLHLNTVNRFGSVYDPLLAFKANGVAVGSKPTYTSNPDTPPVKPTVPNNTVLARQKNLNWYDNAGVFEDGVHGPIMAAWDVHVRKLQAALPHWKGVPALLVDGDYGPRTADAVTVLQSRNGLLPDGVAGPLTIAKLKRGGSNVSNRPPSRG